MIRQTDFWRSFSPSQSNLEGLGEAHEQSLIEKPQVLADALGANVCRQCTLGLSNQNTRIWRLAGVSTAEAEKQFEQLRIALATAFTDAKVMFDNSFDYCLVQLGSNIWPGHGTVSLCNRISTPFRK
jgi:hypothetical protein